MYRLRISCIEFDPISVAEAEVKYYDAIVFEIMACVLYVFCPYFLII